MAENETLCIIFDVNPYYWDNFENTKRYLDSIISFCHAFILFNPSNRLVVIVDSPFGSEFLYDPLAEQADNSGPGQGSQSETAFAQVGNLFATFDRSISDGIRKIFDKTSNSDDSTKQHNPMGASDPAAVLHSPLAGALAKAVCHLSKLAVSVAAGKSLKKRILIFQSGPSNACQYMPMMNCIFACQKQSIAIDCFCIYKTTGLLQQASEITGGTYLSLADCSVTRPGQAVDATWTDDSSEKMAGLFLNSLWRFLPGADLSRLRHRSTVVDCETRCYCHKRPVPIGFVCSRCLTVYCSFNIMCSVCGSRFRNLTA